MRNLITILLVLFILSVVTVGCDGVLTGIGIGAGGSEALQAYEEGLEAKRVELGQLYDEAILAMENAKDPNELEFHKKRAEQVQIAKIANMGALAVVGELRGKPSAEGKPSATGDWKALLITAGIGLVANEIRKRKGFEKVVTQLQGEATPAQATHIHEVVKAKTRILG